MASLNCNEEEELGRDGISSLMACLKCNEEEELGRDEIWEISSWMPAKSAIKILSLSKSLSTIPSHPLFIERQSINSSRFDRGFFLQTSFSKTEFHVPSRDGDSPSTFGIPSDSLSFLHQDYLRIMGSSQGLLLLWKTDNRRSYTKAIICNPATRSWALLPNPDKIVPNNLIPRGYLIECHPRNLDPNNFPSDYTVIFPHIINGPRKPVTCLAVYRHGKWEDYRHELRIDGRPQLSMDKPVGLFRGCNGGIVLHYLCERLSERRPDLSLIVYEKPYLVTYDIDKKAFSRTFTLPEDSWKEEEDYGSFRTPLKIFKWRSPAGDTVGLLRSDKRMFRVWVLEDYEQGRWRRVLAKTAAEIGVPEEDGETVRGCSVMNGTEMLFAMERRVYMYELEGGRLENVGEHRFQKEAPKQDLVFTMYANTLRPVSCGESSVVKF